MRLKEPQSQSLLKESKNQLGSLLGGQEAAGKPGGRGRDGNENMKKIPLLWWFYRFLMGLLPKSGSLLTHKLTPTNGSLKPLCEAL